MNTIDIIVPYAGAELYAPLWATEERDIDFRSEHKRAARCTTAYAAAELVRCLGLTLPKARLRVVERQSASDGPFVELRVADPGRIDDTFALERRGEGVVVTGAGRAGLLYGAYELLRLQGWRWFAPGDDGEFAPEATDRLVLPDGAVKGQASMSFGRGFDFEYVSMESESFFLWMARNRLNVAAYRPATAAFCRKLGMIFKVGGHIFEAILDPDRHLPGGSTIWERHPEWYGLPASGVRRKEEALRIQFCVSRPDLIAFLGAELVRRLQRDWREADRVDLWGFDTWGQSCMCADCRQLGNSADRLLHFAAGIRGEVNRALERGDIGRQVRLIVCAYEGTDTLSGPQRPAAASTIEAGDLVVYYPINRCYEHDFADAGCGANDRYRQALQSWTAAPQPALPVIVGEYYNVSKFEDLPLLFSERLARDIPAYCRMGVNGMTYMHVPLVNWGVRTLTQVLYAQLIWDAETDVAEFLRDYFAAWYGPHADRMRAAYEATERAWRGIADWRSWKKNSVLSLLLAWDGAKPGQPLAVGDHFRGEAAEAVRVGRESLGLLEQALQLVMASLAEDRALSAAQANAPWRVAVNPQEARKQSRQAIRYEMRLGEDRRLLLYGIDTMRLQVELVAYHGALYEGDDALADATWRTIEQTAERMDSYFMPIGYEQPGAGIESKDALTRSQLRELLLRCRAYRLAAAGNGL